MIAEQLKKSILQAAIQGKLTQQLPEDGDARDLLKEIQKEKARLIKEGKIKKEKPLPEITKDEIPFEIPENWCWCRLKELGITQTGNTPLKTHIEYYGDFIPFITPGEILNGVINYSNKGLSEKGKKVGRISEKRSILQVCIGGSIGKCAINTKEITYNQQINAITPILIDYLYLFNYMNSQIFISLMQNKSTGTATPIINKSTWEGLVVSVPPIKEQKRIVNSVNQLFCEIDQLKNDEIRLEELQKSFPKKMKNAILQYAIQGKLTQQLPEDGDARDLLKEIRKEKARLIKEGKIKKEKPLPEITEDEIPFEIPGNWCWVRLGEIGKIINGFTPLRSNSEFWQNKDIPWFTINDIRNQGHIITSTQEYISNVSINGKNRIVQANSVLLCCTASIGEYAFTKINLTTNQQFNGITVKEGYRVFIDPKFIYYYVQTLTEKLLIEAGKTTFPFLSTSKLSNFLIPVGPLTEQLRIINSIEKLLPEINELKNDEVRLKEL